MKTRVAVVYGGRSGEHEVSVRSAEAVMGALDRERYEVVPYFITLEGRWQPGPILPEPGANPHIDVVFPVLHGTFGEDGTVQGLLELADLPYVGPGVLASAVAMDKDVFKRLCAERGLPVADYVCLRSDREISAALQRLPLPVFVKPANAGSSVGISKVWTPDQLESAVRAAAQYDHKVLVERAIAGRELECAVLGNREPAASLPCEILPSREFYDYEDKYLLGAARYELPAQLSAQQTEQVRRMAVEAFQLAECEGMARVDFFLESATGKIFVNEINTIPGFTSISMYPRMWEHCGIAFPTLVERLIELAVERHHRRRGLRYRL